MLKKKLHKKLTTEVLEKRFGLRGAWAVRSEYSQRFLQVVKDLWFPGRLKPSDIKIHFGELSSAPSNATDKLAIFAHFSADGSVDEYVFYHLKQLKELGCDIVFCSTCHQLDASAVTRLRGLCRQVIIRKNIGLDFGSYCAGWLAAQERARYKFVLFTNDSIYGPMVSLQQFFKKFEDSSYHMSGMTDSFEIEFHIQSYFLAFKMSDKVLSFLEGFWRKFRYHNIHRTVTYKYEIGFTREALAFGLNVGAYIPIIRVRDRANERMEELGYVPCYSGRLVNAMRFYWRVVLEDFAHPYLKIDVVSYNPNHTPDLDVLPKVCSDRNYNFAMIQDHLRRKSSYDANINFTNF